MLLNRNPRLDTTLGFHLRLDEYVQELMEDGMDVAAEPTASIKSFFLALRETQRHHHAVAALDVSLTESGPELRQDGLGTLRSFTLIFNNLQSTIESSITTEFIEGGRNLHLPLIIVAQCRNPNTDSPKKVGTTMTHEIPAIGRH